MTSVAGRGRYTAGSRRYASAGAHAMLRRLILGCLSVLAACLVVGCDSDSNGSATSPTPVQGLDIDDIATSASAGDAQGVRRAGAAPAPGSGPRITATGN